MRQVKKGGAVAGIGLTAVPLGDVLRREVEETCSKLGISMSEFIRDAVTGKLLTQPGWTIGALRYVIEWTSAVMRHASHLGLITADQNIAFHRLTGEMLKTVSERHPSKAPWSGITFVDRMTLEQIANAFQLVDDLTPRSGFMPVSADSNAMLGGVMVKSNSAELQDGFGSNTPQHSKRDTGS